MITYALSDIANILQIAAPKEDLTLQGISTDTRTLTPGNCYIAIQGEQFDGHEFVAEALKKGASAAIVSRAVNVPIPQLIVTDTILALGKITQHWRNHFTLPVIGVTGSNGKTTLKNMIASILQAACDNDATRVLATQGNLNNTIGLPLNLAKLNKNHRYAVLEMGMNQPGEIAYLSELVKPAVAVITNAAESHLEGLKDIAGVARAKGEIFSGLIDSGIAVLNCDDTHFNYWRDLIGKRKYLTFGLEHPADVTATLSDTQKILLKTPQGDLTITLPLLGTHNIMNALAATAATLAIDIPLSAIQTGLENVQPAPGRMRQYHLKNNITLIDDTYNANPFSLQAAVNTLATYAGTKILVLGDMKELGDNAKALHAECGEKIRQAGIDYLFTFGNLSEATTESFGKQAEHFTDRDKLLAALHPFLEKSATILVKGSRSMKMETLVAGIIPADQLEQAH